MTKKEEFLEYIQSNITSGSRLECVQRQISTNETFVHNYFFLRVESGMQYFQANFDDALVNTKGDIEILGYTAFAPTA